MYSTVYSQTFDSGPSDREIGTQYNKPLYKGRFSRSWFAYGSLNLREEDNLSTKDKRLEFILFPKCPLFGGLTVVEREIITS